MIPTPEQSAAIARIRANIEHGWEVDAADAKLLLSALEEAQAVRADWQPIETAPKDGTTVLLYSERWDMTWGIQTGHFEGDGEGGGEWVTPEGAVDENEPDYDPDAEVDPDEFDPDSNMGPTIWCPLPALTPGAKP